MNERIVINMHDAQYILKAICEHISYMYWHNYPQTTVRTWEKVRNKIKNQL